MTKQQLSRRSYEYKLHWTAVKQVLTDESQLLRQESREVAKFCATSCSVRFALFSALFVGGMVALAYGANSAIEKDAHVNAYLLALSIAPPIFILVFLSRTFGDSIDRCQVALTFFTAVLWMVPLLGFETWLAAAGGLRAIYRLDPTCDACFDAPACSDNCQIGGQPLRNVYYFAGDGSGSADGSCDLTKTCAAVVPTTLDASPTGPCDCPCRSFTSAYIMAGFFEENLKYLSVITIYTKDYVADPQALVLYAITAGCGFALGENLMYVFTAGFVTPEAGVANGVLRAFTAIPMHAGTACIIGAMLSRRKFLGKLYIEESPSEMQKSERLGWLRIIFLPIFFHGTYDWFLMAHPFDPDLNWSAAMITLMLCWITARYQFVYITARYVDRVNVRELEQQGVLPQATLKGCLCHNIFCCRCGRCGDTENRAMRLTQIQQASASNGKGHYTGLQSSV